MCGVAASGLTCQMPVDTGCRFVKIDTLIRELQHPICHRAGIKRTIPPPGQITACDIKTVERSLLSKALGKPNRHLYRPTVAVSSSQPRKHSGNPILKCFHVHR
jgi:hypothetical protein